MIHGLVPSVTEPIVTTLQERTRLLSTINSNKTFKFEKWFAQIGLCRPKFKMIFLGRAGGGAFGRNGLKYIFIGFEIHFNIFYSDLIHF